MSCVASKALTLTKLLSAIEMVSSDALRTYYNMMSTSTVTHPPTPCEEEAKTLEKLPG
jgi:hypothetical protein